VSITRTVAGLIVPDDFDRADSSTVGGDWVERSGDWQILDDELSVLGSNFWWWIESQAAAARNESFVQSIVRSPNNASSPGISSRFAWNGGSDNAYACWISPNNNQIGISRRVSGAAATVQTTSVTINTDTNYTLQFYTADGVQEGALADGTTVAGSDTSHDAMPGVAACRHQTGSSLRGFWDDFLWCRTKFITVTGLDSGQKAKIRNGSGTVIAEATESGGTAVIDASRFGGATEIVPLAGFADLVVTDSGDTILETYDDTGIYPGDQYSFTAPRENIEGNSPGESQDEGQISLLISIEGDSEGGSFDVGGAIPPELIEGDSPGESFDEADPTINIVGTSFSEGTSFDEATVTLIVPGVVPGVQQISGHSFGFSSDSAGLGEFFSDLIVSMLEVHTQVRSERIGRPNQISEQYSNLNYSRGGGGNG